MIELTARSTIILVVAWILARLLTRATPATRHLVWHGALVAVLLAPVGTLVTLPKLAVVPDVPAVQEPIAQVRHALERLDAIDAPRSTTAAVPAPSIVTDAGVTVRFVALLGSALVGLFFCGGWLSAIRLARRAVPAPLAWQLELRALCDRLRIDREVRLGILDQPTSPLAVGLWRAAILMPEAASGWSDDRRRAVLLHELAHIKRRDCRVQLLAQGACALYWFNPLVWMAASQLRSERERACDDQVLHCGAQPSSYATHLLDIARDLRTTLRPSAALAMARPSELEGRLLSVLQANRARVPFRATRWAVIAILALATAAALSASAATPQGVNPIAIPFEPGSQYIVANDVMASSDRAPAPLAKAEVTLHTSDDPQDRELATLALAFASGRDVIPALLQALSDPDAQVREKAAVGLALRRDARVVEPLIAAMSDPDSQVREKAAIALGTSGDPRGREALVRGLNDPDSQVREKAAAALVLLGVAN